MAEENRIFPGIKPIDFDGPKLPAWIRGGAKTLDDIGNIIAGAVDKTPVGATVDWIDRKTGNNLAKGGNALHNLFSGENLSLPEYRKRDAERYQKSAETHPKTAFAADIGAGIADPTARPVGILGALAGGGAYGLSSGYANAAKKADREMQPVNYGLGKAALNTAVGAGFGLGGHTLINNPLSRRGVDWAANKFQNGRHIIADALRKLEPLPEAEKKAIRAFRETERSSEWLPTPTELTGQDLRAKVVATDEPVSNAVGRQREADFGFNPETGRNNFTGSRRDSDASILNVLSQEKRNLDNALKKLNARETAKSPGKLEQAQKEYDEALDTYNRRYNEITDVRNAYNRTMFEGTPTEQQLANINPARKYSEKTGALRGQLGEGYNPDQVATPELHVARKVIRNAALPESVPNERAMWRGDLNLRRSGIPQEEAENIYSQLAKGTTDPVTGSGKARTSEERGIQGTIFEKNKAELYDVLDAGSRIEDSAVGRMLRPKEPSADQLKNWSAQQKSDLTRIIRDPEYAAKAAAGNAEAGGLTATQQQDIARGLTRRRGAASIANALGEAGVGATAGGALGSATGAYFGGVIGAPIGSSLGAGGGAFLDKILKKIPATRAIPQDMRTLRYELDRALRKLNGLPETGRFYEPNPFQSRGGILAARIAQMGWNNKGAADQPPAPDGKWVNVPSLVIDEKTGKWAEFQPDDEEGISAFMDAYERRHGQTFTRYKSLEEAEEAAKSRSASGGAGNGLQIKNNAQNAFGIGTPPQKDWRTTLNIPPSQGNWQEQVRKANKPDFWDGIGRILAGIIAMKTGARFDYNINDRIKSLQDNYGLDAQTAIAVGSDPAAYQKLIAQKEDMREKDRIAQRNAALKQQQPQKMEIKTLSDGTVLGINPYTGEKTVIQEGSGQKKLSSRQQIALNEIANRSRGLESAKKNLADLKEAVTARGDSYINPVARATKEYGLQWGLTSVDDQWLAHRRIEQILRTVPIMLQGVVGTGDSRGSDKLRKMLEESHAIANEPADVINDYIDRLNDELDNYIALHNEQRKYVISGYDGFNTENEPEVRKEDVNG